MENKNELKLRVATFKQFAEANPAFTVSVLRWLRFTDRDDFNRRCIIRRGRSLLLDIENFEEWLKDGRGSLARAGRR